MIIEMQKNATRAQITGVQTRIRELGFYYQENSGQDITIIAVLGKKTGEHDTQGFEAMPGVERVIRIEKPFKLASRRFKEKDTIVTVGDVKIGGKEIVMMAGPCSVESEDQLLACAELVKRTGAKILRGGAFKPRTSPFEFQGLKEEGLRILEKARQETGLLIVTEVMAVEDVPKVADCADILQIGTRNMQNYPLLTAVGKTKKTVLLKRGLAATIEEWLTAADWIMKEHNPNVILCERGIRTFSNGTRYTLDVSAVPLVKHLSHLPIIIDPSHAAGHWQYVPSLACAGIAVGADGLIIEVHPDPKKALSDGAQSLTFSDFTRLSKELKLIAAAIGRSM
jgi:3-deoxy-7-phosphoheptulonate synthase